MKSIIPLIALAALAACNQKQPEVVESRAADPNAAAIANAAPVELPPAIRSQKTYRCTDQSLVYVNWFVGDKVANVRTEANAQPTRLTSATETGGSPWASADGATKLTGTDSAITYTAGGGKPLSCKG